MNNRIERMKRNKKKTKVPDVPENNIPDEIHLKAEMVARALMNHPPMTQKELKKKLKEQK